MDGSNAKKTAVDSGSGWLGPRCPGRHEMPCRWKNPVPGCPLPARHHRQARAAGPALCILQASAGFNTDRARHQARVSPRTTGCIALLHAGGRSAHVS
ncbi:conserved hypothetical protein [Ricinus communis]|uniref:Uncharacterized protein n=1 Tax=Ricinus communis TaxID=3988 RepID=B9T9Q5_RICCO|nr:conserved hypothetical protein [Ricinus communis]